MNNRNVTATSSSTWPYVEQIQAEIQHMKTYSPKLAMADIMEIQRLAEQRRKNDQLSRIASALESLSGYVDGMVRP